MSSMVSSWVGASLSSLMYPGGGDSLGARTDPVLLMGLLAEEVEACKVCCKEQSNVAMKRTLEGVAVKLKTRRKNGSVANTATLFQLLARMWPPRPQWELNERDDGKGK